MGHCHHVPIVARVTPGSAVSRRTRMMRAFRAALLLGAGAALQSCGAGGARQQPRTDTIVIGTASVPQSLDPIMSSDVQTELTVASAYDKLVDFDENSILKPALATSWQIGDGGRSLTLKLRHDVRFHSGNRFTAKDVIYTLDRIKALGVGVAAFIPEYGSAIAAGPFAATIHLPHPNVAFISALSKIYMLDSALVAAHEGSDRAQSWLAAHDAGSGVYRLLTYIPGQRAMFSRFDPSWRQDERRPKKLSYLYLPNSSTIAQELSAGTVDIGISLAIPDVRELNENGGVRSVYLPTPLQFYAFLNMRKGLTADRRIRQAIALAYDYQGHVRTILENNGDVATGLAAPSIKCRLAVPAARRDMMQARRLVQEVGAEGKTMTLVYNPAFPEHRRGALALQSGLKQIGLQLRLQPTTFPQYMAMLGNPALMPEISMVWDFPNYPEIGPMLSRMFESDHIGTSNYSLYANADVDRFLRAGLKSSDSRGACDDFKRAQAIILRDLPAINISNARIAIVARKGIGGPAYRPTYQLLDPSTLTMDSSGNGSARGTATR